MIRRLIIAGVMVSALVLVTGPDGFASEAARQKYNVIIVCLDTLRAGHLRCYGYERETSPNIDALAASGVRFEWAFAQSNFTASSIASLFTGRFVRHHGLDSIERKLSDQEITLAEVLRRQGYKTAAFICNAVQLYRYFNLQQGFDRYVFEEVEDKTVSFAVTVPAALDWIKHHVGSPFFVFLHSNDIHEPYHSAYENMFDPEYRGRLDDEYLGTGKGDFHATNLARSPREKEHIIAHYDGGIRYADHWLGIFINQLKELSVYEKTLIIILSDHGEVLGDRGMGFYHGFGLHDEEVHVPLAIILPRGVSAKEAVISEQVQLVDIFPTVLDILDIPSVDPVVDGLTLKPLWTRTEGQVTARDCVYAESITGESRDKSFINHKAMVRAPLRKIIAGVWKEKNGDPVFVRLHNGAFVMPPYEDTFELYDLQKDPLERDNQDGKDITGQTKSLWEQLLAY